VAADASEVGGWAEPVDFSGSVLSHTMTCYNAAGHPTVERRDLAALGGWRRLWW